MCSSSICLWWNKLLMTKQLSVSRAGGIHPLWTQHVFLVVALYFFVYKRAGYVFTISMYVLPFLIYFQFEICIYLYSILTLRWLVKPQGTIFHCSWTLKQHVYMTDVNSVPGGKNVWIFTDYQLLDNISKGLSNQNTQSQNVSSSVTVTMGFPVTIMAVFLVLLATGVQTLNPDDPNVCSHWERWVQTSHEGQFEC